MIASSPVPRLFIVLALVVSAVALPRGAAAQLNLDTFKANLVEEFDGQFVGYAFAVARNGDIRRAGAGGWARIPGDGNKPMGTRTRQNVASVTKTITAIAVLQLLDANGLSINSPIAPHLPAGWARGYGFQNANSLTFRELLSHTSGLKHRFNGLSDDEKAQWGNDWDGIEYAVSLGVNPGDVGKYGYKNLNFALFRIVIPILWMKSLGAPWGGINALNAGPIHMLYVGAHIFGPSGVNAASCEEPADKVHAAGYDVTAPAGPGKIWNVPQTNCGGHGNWHLSARQLVKIAMRADSTNYPYLPAGEQLLSPGACIARDLFKLGWNKDSNGAGDKDDKYWHSGVLFTSKTQPHKAVRATVTKLPGGINVAAIVNSSSLDGENPARKIIDAYEASK